MESLQTTEAQNVPKSDTFTETTEPKQEQTTESANDTLIESTQTSTEKSDIVKSKTFKGPKKTTISALHVLSEKTGKNHTEILDLAIENLLKGPETVKSDVHKFNPECEGCQDEMLQRGYVVLNSETWNKVRHYV